MNAQGLRGANRRGRIPATPRANVCGPVLDDGSFRVGVPPLFCAGCTALRRNCLRAFAQPMHSGPQTSLDQPRPDHRGWAM